MRVGISSDSTDADGAAGPGAGVRRDGRRRARQRGLHRGDLRRPGRRREAVHRRGPRPRHQGQHPADDGRARHRGARAAGHLLPRGRAGASSPDGLFFSNGPGDPAATTGQVELLQGALERGLPYFGICFGNQLFGRALGFGTYKLKYGHRGINQPVMDRTTGKVEVTAHNHGFAVDAPLEGPTETPYGEATVSHVCLNDDVVEGLELRDADGQAEELLGAVPPRGGGRPARCGVPVRPVRRPDVTRTTTQRGERLMPKRDDIKSVLVIGSRADHHRPGLRVRLLRHPGLPGAQGRGAAGHPGQLQPGDDHDRPGVRRRDLRRADHRGVRREGDREGAPRRAARDAGRPDRAEHGDGPRPARRAGEVRRGADRRQHRGDQPRREPRVVQEDRRGARRRVSPARSSATPSRTASRPPRTSAGRWWCAPASRWAAPARGWPTTRTTCAASPAPAWPPARPPRCSSRSRSSAGRSTSSRSCATPPTTW